MDEHGNNAPESVQAVLPADAPVDSQAAGAAENRTPSPPEGLSLGSAAKRRAGGRELTLAAVLLLWGSLLWDCLIWADGLGLGEALALAGLFLSGAVYLHALGKRRTGYGTLCGLLYLAGALSLACSGDSSLKALTLVMLGLLFLLNAMERLELRTGAGIRARLRDLCRAAFAVSIAQLPEACRALFRGDGTDGRRKKLGGILAGLCFAIPALVILMPLLVSSDAAFEGLMSRLDWGAAGRGALALGFGFCTAMPVFTLLFLAQQPKPRSAGAGNRGLEPVTVITFLSAISLAYLLYLAAQFAYFTDAFRGLLPRQYTVAQYARRGFFEMCAIVFINLGLIVLATRLCRKDGGRLPGAVKGLALFLCLFSLALVATALSKMVLYMGSFGLTRLRVLTSVFMVYLALLVAAVGVKLTVRRLPALQLAVGLGAALLIALSLVNVDGLVARYNVAAYRSGRLDSLDMDTVCWLGDGAVPTLCELLDDPDPDVAARAREELAQRMIQHGLASESPDRKPDTDAAADAILRVLDEPADLRSWNLISHRARVALLACRDRIIHQ